MTPTEIDTACAALDEARAAKDYTRADAIRCGLLELREIIGPFEWRLSLSTGKDGTLWHWSMQHQRDDGET